MAKVTGLNNLAIDLSKTAENLQDTAEAAQSAAENAQPVSANDVMNQVSGGFSASGLEYSEPTDPNVTGHAATVDSFYTSVEQFQNAYEADTYAAVASDLGYTANLTNGGGIYEGAQSLLAVTGNISNFIDAAQVNLPDGLNGVIDAIQVGVGSIRENFYELLEAQQQYGFLKGLKVWFTAKTEPEKYFTSNTAQVFNEGYNQNSAEWLYAFNDDLDSLGEVTSMQDLTQDLDFMFNPLTGIPSIPALEISNIIMYGDPYANIDLAMEDAINQIDENFQMTMEYDVLKIASERHISIAEAQNILAQKAIGENPEEGLMAQYGLLEQEDPDDDLEERVEDTDNRYFDMGFGYDEDDGLYTYPMSCADRKNYADLLFDPETGILNENINAYMEQSGYSREEVILSLDSIYGLGISFDEDGDMYCKPYIELLADQYPELQEYLETNNYNFGYRDDGWIAERDNGNIVAFLTVAQLEELGVPAETAEWYMANTTKMYSEDVDIYLNNNPDYIVPNSPEAEQAGLVEEDMEADNGVMSAANKFLSYAEGKYNAGKQKAASVAQSVQANSAIPDAVEENYTTDTSAEDEYGM